MIRLVLFFFFGTQSVRRAHKAVWNEAKARHRLSGLSIALRRWRQWIAQSRAHRALRSQALLSEQQARVMAVRHWRIAACGRAVQEFRAWVKRAHHRQYVHDKTENHANRTLQRRMFLRWKCVFLPWAKRVRSLASRTHKAECHRLLRTTFQRWTQALMTHRTVFRPRLAALWAVCVRQTKRCTLHRWIEAHRILSNQFKADALRRHFTMRMAFRRWCRHVRIARGLRRVMVVSDAAVIRKERHVLVQWKHHTAVVRFPPLLRLLLNDYLKVVLILDCRCAICRSELSGLKAVHVSAHCITRLNAGNSTSIITKPMR
jgi:hypothetical protein